MSIITQVIVDANDPAFLRPDKPIGPFYEKKKRSQRESGWAGRWWRIPEEAGEEWWRRHIRSEFTNWKRSGRAWMRDSW